MEAIIFDAITWVLCWIDLNMVFCSVEDMCHSDSLEILDVTDGVTVAEDDAIKNFVTINPQISSLIIVTG